MADPWDQFEDAPAAAPRGSAIPSPVIPRQPPPQTEVNAERDRIALERDRVALERDQAQATGGAGLQPDSVDFLAQQWLMTGQMPTLGSGKDAAAARQSILNRATDLAGAKDKTPQEAQVQFARYRTNMAALQQAEKNYMAIRGNEQTALLNARQFMERSRELSLQTGIPVVNRITQFGLRQTGDPTITASDIAHQTFLTEYAKVVAGSPSGAGVLSDSARHEALDMLQSSATMEQKEAAFKQLEKDMQNRMEALRASIEDGYRALAGTQPEAVHAASAPAAERPSGKLDEGNVFIGERGNGQAQITSEPVRYATDQDRRFAAIIQAVLNRGGTAEEANALADKYGYPKIGGKPVYDPAAWNEAVRYNKTRPKGAPPATVEVPEQGVRQESNTVAALGGGDSALVAGLSGAGTGVLAGFDDEVYGGIDSILSGKSIDEAIAEMDYRKGLVRSGHPGAYLAGEIGGAVATQIGAGAALARTAPRLALPSGAGALAPRALAGDAAYGAAYGAGENNEDRVGGALGGAALGAVGGAGGRALPKVGAALVDPVVPAAVRTLRDKGVRTTLGQSIGPTASAVEEKLTSLPVVGSLVASGRRRALGDFNRAVVDDALKPIGKQLPEGASGTNAMAFAQNAFDDAYAKARSGMRLSPDPQLVTELQALEQKVLGGGLPDASASRLRKIYDTHVGRRLKAGPLSGDDYKKMMSSLGKLQRGSRASDPELSSAIGDLSGALDAAARRSSPAEAAAAMDAADEGYALFVRAENAAAMAGGETGTFTPSQYGRAVQRGDGSVRSRAYLRGDALGQDMADAGRSVLGDKVPNSGTPERLGMGAATLGAAYIEPSTLAVAGGLGAAYSPGVRDVLASLFAGKRGKGATAVGGGLRKRARIAGAAGVPLGLAYQDK